MKTFQIEIPEMLVKEIEEIVAYGWFRNSDEVVVQAIREFANRNRLELIERYQLEDVD